MRKFVIAIITCLMFLVPVAAMATDWNGNGSDSIEDCQDGQASYLHWVFTGGDGEDSVTLTVNGDTYQMEQKGKSGKGAWHATTPFYDPDNTTASTNADGGVLTISDGCTGEVVVQPTPSETPTESETPSEKPTQSERPTPQPTETKRPAVTPTQSPTDKPTATETPSVTETPVPSETESEVPPVTLSEDTPLKELPRTGVEGWLLGIGAALLVLGGMSVDLTRRFN